MSRMRRKELYSGSVRWIPITVIFMLRLLCFSLLTIGFWKCANSWDVALNNTGGYRPLKHDPKLIEIHKRLRALNKPAVKSIQSPDGDIIDCVLRHKQLAFDHPLLKNHTIQTASRRPHGLRSSSKANRTCPALWNLTGMRCPDGTVPVRRITVEQLVRSESPELYGKRPSGFHLQSGKYRDPNAPPIGPKQAIAYAENGPYYGAEATLNIWRPYVEIPQEYSASFMALVAGSSRNDELNAIAVGWHVYPALNSGGGMTTLFVFWTRDASLRTGCYNTICPGFVQTSPRLAVGSMFPYTSTYDGNQCYLDYFVQKDPVRGSWVLYVHGGMEIGYWPAEIFTHLAHSAQRVKWGGEILNLYPDGRHTRTQMGSGHFPREGPTRASYFIDLTTVDENREKHDAVIAGTRVDDPDFYGIAVSDNRHAGQFLFYGGPGFDADLS